MESLKQKIMSYKNEALIKKFMKEQDCSQEEAEAVFEEMKKFLYVCHVSDIASVPSKTVDAMWHEFILRTKDYAVFSKATGKFIHHNPSEPEKPKNTNGYERTIQLVEFYFGTLVSALWPQKKLALASASCESFCGGDSCEGE